MVSFIVRHLRGKRDKLVEERGGGLFDIVLDDLFLEFLFAPRLYGTLSYGRYRAAELPVRGKSDRISYNDTVDYHFIAHGRVLVTFVLFIVQ